MDLTVCMYSQTCKHTQCKWSDNSNAQASFLATESFQKSPVCLHQDVALLFFIMFFYDPDDSSAYSPLFSILRISPVTPWRSSSDSVLTREVLATPPFSIGSLLKRFCLDLAQPVFLRPQRTHKNTLAKAETTLQCVCLHGVSEQSPFNARETLDNTWLCCGNASSIKKNTNT